MTVPNGYVRASRRLTITLLQPVRPAGHQEVSGTLLGAMHDRGTVLHYRVDVGNRTVLLAPPAWLHPDSRLTVAQAGLDVPKHMQRGMFVAAFQRLTEQWADPADVRKPEDVA